MLTKSRGQGVIPLAPVAKSLWTCTVEYCCILYDVYPPQEDTPTIGEHRATTILLEPNCSSALAAVGPPNVMHSLVAAVESLCKIPDRVAIRWRIICLTNAS
ncbi:unnamed protein product [Coregonus sp. 'balchen']|nr:unnamed protein product [Coregonus sp. 'balchen']